MSDDLFMRTVAAALLIVCTAAARDTGDAGDLSRRAAAALDKDPALAARLYRQALQLRPQWPEGWFYLGASEFQLGQYPAAARDFRKASELAPANGPARAFLGLAEFSLNEFHQARANLETGVQLGIEGDPHFSSQVHTRLAGLQVQASDFGAALTQLAPLLKAGERSDPVILILGLIALQRAASPAALPPGEQAVVLQAGQAMRALQLEGPDHACPAFAQLAKQYPREPGVHYAYAVLLAPADPTAALAEMQAELRLNPRNLNATIESTLLQIKAGNREAALENGQQAIRLDSNSSAAHLAYGRALLKANQLGPACRELEQAVRLAPENPATHFYLAQAYHRAGRTADADRQTAAFRQLQPAGTEP